MIQIIRTDSNNPDFRALIPVLDRELRANYDDSMDFYDQHNVIEDNRHVILAYEGDDAIGCGCFKEFNGMSAEMKRMFVRPEYRGKGVSKIVLSALEEWAKEMGYKASVLETGTKQEIAMELYKKAGYLLIENFPPYVDMPESICFGKEL